MKNEQDMSQRFVGKMRSALLAAGMVIIFGIGVANAADKPNNVLIVSDDFSYSDAGVFDGSASKLPIGLSASPKGAWPAMAKLIRTMIRVLDLDRSVRFYCDWRAS